MYFLNTLSVCIVWAGNFLSIVLLGMLFVRHYTTNEIALRLVRAFNATFLMGSILFTFVFLVDAALESNKGLEYGNYAFITHIFDSYWFLHWWVIINFSIAPLQLFFKKYRASRIVVPCIALSNLVFDIITADRVFRISLNGMLLLYFGIALIHFVIAYTAVYLVIKYLDKREQLVD